MKIYVIDESDMREETPYEQTPFEDLFDMVASDYYDELFPLIDALSGEQLAACAETTVAWVLEEYEEKRYYIEVTEKRLLTPQEYTESSEAYVRTLMSYDWLLRHPDAYDGMASRVRTEEYIVN